MGVEGQYDGVNPDVLAGFSRYVEQTEGAGPDERQEREESRPSSREREERPALRRQPPVEELPDDELEDDELEEAEGDDEEEGDEEDAAASEGDEDEGLIETWDELVHALGDDFDPTEVAEHVRFEVGDGERVPLSELVSAYRNGPTLDEAARAEVEQHRKKLNEEADARAQQLTETLARVVSRVERHREPAGGWDELRRADPESYIRLREEQEADRRDAEALLGHIRQENDRRQQEEQQSHSAWVEEQKIRLMRLKPEWRNPEQLKQAFGEIEEYLEPRFGRQVVENLEDAQFIVSAWEAAQYRKSLGKKSALKKRLRKVPRRQLRATARDEQSPGRAQNKKRQARIDRLRQTGRVEDAAELLKEMV